MGIIKKYTPVFCRECETEIIRKWNESIPAYSKRKFCSHSCQDAWNTKQNSRIINCSTCGTPFKRMNSKIKDTNFCNSKCQSIYYSQIGTKEVSCSWCGTSFKKVLSQASKTNKHFCSRECFGNWQSKFIVGESSYGWKNGKTELSHRIRTSKKNINWILSVFKRDKFTCQDCGDSRGGNLNAHHIVKLQDILRDYQIQNMEDALNCNLLWDTNNGITLCESCHVEIHRRK